MQKCEGKDSNVGKALPPYWCSIGSCNRLGYRLGVLTYGEHNRPAHTRANSGYQVLRSDFTEHLGTRLLGNCESQNTGTQNKSSKFTVKFGRSSNNPYQPYPDLSLSSFCLVHDHSLDLAQVRMMMTSEEHTAAIPRFLMLVHTSASPV